MKTSGYADFKTVINFLNNSKNVEVMISSKMLVTKNIGSIYSLNMSHLPVPDIKMVQMTKFRCQNVCYAKIHLWFDKIFQESAVSTVLTGKNTKTQ